MTANILLTLLGGGSDVRLAYLDAYPCSLRWHYPDQVQRDSR